MNMLQAIILGIVEGITEFLPISSTFHLIFTSKLLGIEQTEFTKVFEVFIQAGAVLSVVILYIKELWTDRDLMKKVVVSFVPTAVIGFLFYKVVKDVFFEAEWLMISMLFIVGVIFIIVERFSKKGKEKSGKNVKKITTRDAVIIGFIQALAIIPGVSRAGSVIVGMIFLGYERSNAAKYSFMLSIPTILAASGYDLLKMRHVLSDTSENTLLLIVGFLSAFISSFFVVKWLIDYLKNHSLEVFGWYRILLVIIILLIFLLR